MVCIPLVQIRSGSSEETRITTNADATVGLLYLDSRALPADLSAGNRELLQTLAMEASTILENARLIEEERGKQRMEDELQVAREIQQGLLPASLPSDGWFRASGSSQPSTQVGGDYFDVRQIRPDLWSAVVADVSGKGVSSALLAGLLQGVFLMAGSNPGDLEGTLSSLNGVPAGAHPRRKIRDRFLLHHRCHGPAALCQRRPLRAVPGRRRRPLAQAAHLWRAGGHARGNDGANGRGAAGAGRQSYHL